MTLVMMGLTNFMTMMLKMISLPIYLLGVRLISALVMTMIMTTMMTLMMKIVNLNVLLPIHLLDPLDLYIGDLDEDLGNYVFVDYNIGDDEVDNGESLDDDDDDDKSDKSSSLYQCRA